METAIVIIACAICFWSGYYFRDKQSKSINEPDTNATVKSQKINDSSNNAPKDPKVSQWAELLKYNGPKKKQVVKTDDED